MSTNQRKAEKNLNKISKKEPTIIINADGVQSPDKRGNLYYCGYLQTKPSMIYYYFTKAQEYWANQTLNGMPLQLLEIQVQIAANNSVPYNCDYQIRRVPHYGNIKRQNRAAWYNVKFNIGETGWICNKLYMTMFDAASNIAADTAYQLYSDAKVIKCVQNVMKNQKSL